MKAKFVKTSSDPDPAAFALGDVSAKLTPSAIQARIAEIRMGDIVVKTKPGSNVKIQQTRHEFQFGTAITNRLAEADEDALKSRDRKMFLKTLSENFNYAVHENALKWYECEKKPNAVDYTVADRIWEICRDLNIPMRGHCIFWEMDEHIMPWLRNLDNDRLRAAIHRRAVGVTKHFKGRIDEFDLNNEMVHGEFFRRRLGYGIVNEMANMAKCGNPNIILYANDYGILVDGCYNALVYFKQIKYLLENGVPIEGIGMQGHFGYFNKWITPADEMQKTLDQFAVFGLPIKITECDFDYKDDKTKVSQLRKFFTLCFAHQSIESIVFWGFWAGAMWRPNAALWKKDWSITPLGRAYRDLVFNKWWTKTSGKADNKGTFKTRAFYGDYTITSNGQEKKITLRRKDKSIQADFR
ncbi:MAG: endo-1,4-beta-xylanase [Phycisphaerae bacterium]|nr:endo-1,4-beta-xylanase [Phycisphaerae bacterium]MDD5381903.1 endo-1,4-beta-xylanase [Phycisphaerae bacterium]